MQSTDKVVINVEECREMNIDLSPPSVNRGEFKFVADTESSIVYGLGAVKGLGEGPIDVIVEGRSQAGNFKDLYDLCHRSDARKLNKRALEALIGCGALDELAVFENQTEKQKEINYRRALLMANQMDAVKVAEQKARNQDGGLMDLFGEDIHAGSDEGTPYNHFSGLRNLTFKERLNKEKESLGLYLTGHPIDIYKDELKHLSRTKIADLRVGKDEQIVAGLVVGIRTMKSKKGETIGFLTLDDRSDRLEVGIFGDLYELHHAKLRKDAVLFCKGNLSVDDFSGSVRMRVTDVYDLIEARERSARRLRLCLSEEDLRDNFCTELAGILSPYTKSKSLRPGYGCLVAVDYSRESAQAEVALGEDWRVCPDDDLIQNLRDRYGDQKVMLDY